MGTPIPNGPTSHPGGNCIELHQHTVSAANIHPPFPQRAQHNRATGGLCPDLRRAQSLLTYILLTSPPTGPHLGNTWPRCSHRDVPPPHTPSIVQTRKFTASLNADPIPPGDGAILPVQRGRGRTARPECPCGDNHAGSPPRHAELCAPNRIILGRLGSHHPVHGHMSMSHWPLLVSIRQGLCRKPLFWYGSCGYYPQVSAIFPALLQHSVSGRRGDGSSVWV